MRRLIIKLLRITNEAKTICERIDKIEQRLDKFEVKEVAPLITENEDLKRQIKELEYRLKRKSWEVQYLNNKGLKIDFSAFFRAMDEHDLIKGLRK